MFFVWSAPSAVPAMITLPRGSSAISANMKKTASLLLEDGTVFRGMSFGAPGFSVGEVVFNTAMTGYQEILTDPSYARQIVTLTYPHIGNTGANSEDEESRRVYAAGLVVRDCPATASSWRREDHLGEYLRRNDTVAIAGVDTRRLTRHLREHGACNGVIFDQDTPVEQARTALDGCAGLEGADLAAAVSPGKAYTSEEGGWGDCVGFVRAAAGGLSVVAYDFGIKRNILRILTDAGCRVTVVPAQTDADAVLADKPDGVFLSNGPGDPAPCDYAIAAIRRFVHAGVPTFGICLGHQLLGLACGARTVKMKFGHHGANHPVLDLATGRVLITSQNHGFCVDETTLPACLRPTHRSLFDKSLQGVHHTDKPAFGFQGHPEASPGPHDVRPLFSHFIELMRAHA